MVVNHMLGTEPRTLEEQQILLTAASSLQPRAEVLQNGTPVYYSRKPKGSFVPRMV